MTSCPKCGAPMGPCLESNCDTPNYYPNHVRQEAALKINRAVYDGCVHQANVTPEQLLRWMDVPHLSSTQDIWISVRTSCGDNGRYYRDNDCSILMDVEVRWVERTPVDEDTYTGAMHDPIDLIKGSP